MIGTEERVKRQSKQKFSTDMLEGERVYRKVFKYGKVKEIKDNLGNVIGEQDNRKEILVTCVFKENSKNYYGFSVKSPKDIYNSKHSLRAARGRCRRAIANGTKMEYPRQRWIKKDQFISMIAEIKDAKNNYKKVDKQES
jgi:hypothetical protein